MPVTLAHEVFGSGEPLIILHGLFGSRRNWMSMARGLAECARVIAVDLRNHGASGHADTMSFAEMADDVRALLDELGLEKATVAGHSLGGKVAMRFALEHAARTQRLLVLDVAPVRYDGGSFRRYIDAMQALPLDRITSRSEAEAALAPAVPQMALRQFLLHNLAREDGRFGWRLNLEAIGACLGVIGGWPAPPAEARYDGPAVFIAGARSTYLQLEHVPEIRRLFPRAELKVIEGAGHWLHADQPEAVLAEMCAFLATPA